MGWRLVVFTLYSLTLAARAWPADQAVPSSPSNPTLAFFEEHATDSLDGLLTRLRPSPLDAATRAQVLASLPRHGELRPSRREAAKIAAAERMLECSARKGAISVKVIDVDCAFAGLYQRTVILVSRQQLAILDTDEFVALAAHEVGHDRTGRLLDLTFDAEKTVRIGLHVALARLKRPGCAAVFQDFLLPDGRTAQSELDRRRIGPRELLESLVFADGSSAAACHNGPTFLFTTPGSPLIRVCPGFSRLGPSDSAIFIIHESLHALGLGENPPTSREVTNRVQRRCR